MVRKLTRLYELRLAEKLERPRDGLAKTGFERWPLVRPRLLGAQHQHRACVAVFADRPRCATAGQPGAYDDDRA